ncbi:regulator of nonsense transcripts 1-like protein [Iris pallida]|uniref:Regulator of nonsense transcripts 1-like protein n=1 Tax=Iris pallida TaxID=29817 RepID=A0AAX6DG16_IRIPA|nr:regulator of nonsense transcripts 1-like protein [Iris pallida]
MARHFLIWTMILGHGLNSFAPFRRHLTEVRDFFFPFFPSVKSLSILFFSLSRFIRKILFFNEPTSQSLSFG